MAHCACDEIPIRKKQITKNTLEALYFNFGFWNLKFI